MKIAVIGAGRVGRALASGLTDAGHTVAIAVRDPASPGACSAAADGLPVLPLAWAGDDADVVVLAVPHAAIPEVLGAIGGDPVIVDASNNLETGPAGPRPSGVTGADLVIAGRPGARVVKAFNTIGWEHLAGARFPAPGAAMPLCGTVPTAREVVATLASDLGFTPVDLGGIAQAVALEHLAAMWVKLSLDRGRDFAFAVVDGHVE